jgi:hypothetical protein
MGPKPALVISKENCVGLPKGFWAKMKDQVERPAEMAFKFKQGFSIQKSKIQILLKLNLNWSQTKINLKFFEYLSNLELLKIAFKYSNSNQGLNGRLLK